MSRTPDRAAGAAGQTAARDVTMNRVVVPPGPVVDVVVPPEPVVHAGLPALALVLPGSHRRYLLCEPPGPFPYRRSPMALPGPADLIVLRGEVAIGWAADPPAPGEDVTPPESNDRDGDGEIVVRAGQQATVPGGVVHWLTITRPALFELFLPPAVAGGAATGQRRG